MESGDAVMEGGRQPGSVTSVFPDVPLFVKPLGTFDQMAVPPTSRDEKQERETTDDAHEIIQFAHGRNPSRETSFGLRF